MLIFVHDSSLLLSLSGNLKSATHSCCSHSGQLNTHTQYTAVWEKHTLCLCRHCVCTSVYVRVNQIQTETEKRRKWAFTIALSVVCVSSTSVPHVSYCSGYTVTSPCCEYGNSWVWLNKMTVNRNSTCWSRVIWEYLSWDDRDFSIRSTSSLYRMSWNCRYGFYGLNILPVD